MVGALLREEAAADRVGWHLTCFGDPAAFEVELADAAKEVDSVVGCRVINRKTIVAGVSGGVSVQPLSLCASSRSARSAMGRSKPSVSEPAKTTGSSPRAGGGGIDPEQPRSRRVAVSRSRSDFGREQ